MADLTVTDPKLPFRGSQLKVMRAKRHLAELEDIVAEYLATKPVSAKGEVSAQGVSIRMDVVGVPDIASTIAGDIFHNLRAALDLMACEVVRLNNQSDDDVYFPFCDDEAFLDTMIKRRNFHRASADAVRLLKELKPYKGGNVALRAIHDFDIQDKHQTLMVTPVSFYSPVFTLMNDKGEYAPTFVNDPNEATEVRLVFAAGSALGEQDFIPTLHNLVETTAAVIERFKALCAPAG